jgi:hypothetical protein
VLYQVMFLTNDSRQDVYVEQIENIDSEELGKHPQLGESVFITNSAHKKRNAWRD